jgi:hypothetical protein
MIRRIFCWLGWHDWHMVAESTGKWEHNVREERLYHFVCPACGLVGLKSIVTEYEKDMPTPCHAYDCALSVNARHGCTCGAEPNRTAIQP